MSWQDVIDSLNTTGALPGAETGVDAFFPISLVDPADPYTAQQPGYITVVVNGVPQQFNTVKGVAEAIANGGTPLDHNGNPAQVSMPFGGSGGGILINGQPINYVFNQQYLPGQEEALHGLGLQTGTPYTPPPTTKPAGTGGTIPYNPANPGDYGLENYSPLQPSGIPSISLPNPELMSQLYDPEFHNQYTDTMEQFADRARQNWNYQVPDLQAAQFNPANVPQPNAQQMSISPEIQRMLSGEGYAPNILAQMRGRAIDDAAAAGRTELSQTKRALEQAGLSESPAGAAVAGDVARREGIAQSQALRDLDIQNADVGMENFRQGVGYQTSIGQSNMQAANAMALENANRLFSAMSQNVANQQETNLAKFGAESTRQQQQANAGSSIIANEGQALQQGKVNLFNTAQQQNANTKNQFALTQAQLERQRQMANQNALESRWQTAATDLPGWTPIPNAGYTPTQGYSPFAS